ncbi:MAG: LysR family transcriptional regulator [Rhodobacteraceae bacterium]|nr:LysR family transcriptional regulator [Paracoccaceae bacterium]
MRGAGLNGLSVLVAVVRHGSLTRAAAALGVRQPAISYQLKVLEADIGTPLLTRTTRSLSLTDAGHALLARAAPALAELEEALLEARDKGGAVKGRVRLTLPYIAFDMTIAARLHAFRQTYPEIELDLSFSEAFVDIIAEGVHAGIRLGENIRPDMVAVRLCPPFREVVFASPAYLAAHGRPRHPHDLSAHDCIRYRYISSGRFADWRFRLGEEEVVVDVRGGLIVNSTPALVRAATLGNGLGWLFRPSVARELERGELESVLDDYAIQHPGYFLYFPRSSGRIPAFRAFVDFMQGGHMP